MPGSSVKPERSYWRFLAACILACLFCAAGRASVINDPQMGMEDIGASNPFNNGTVLTPGPGGGGAFDFYNPTGQTIVQMAFTVQLLSGLDTTTVDDAFACNNASTPGEANPFFLFCSINYFPSNGMLLITFSGTGGSDQGILPLLPTCNNDPNSPDSTSPVNCTSQGHFLITLNNNFAPTGDSGGWSASGNAGLFGDNPPQVTFSSFQTDASTTGVPEPGTAAMMGIALASAAGLLRRLRILPIG